jgi:biopolymer transport protein ExbB
MEWLALQSMGGVEFSVILDEVLHYWRGGGFVMPPLVAATVVLWFAIGWRFVVIRGGYSGELRTLVKRASRGNVSGDGLLERAAIRGIAAAQVPTRDVRPWIEDTFQDLRNEAGRFSTLVSAIVAAAPLAGLLGTVTGMIETFASLQEMALFTQSGGVAGGISTALISTQMGLAVAIPGMLAGRVLDRREARLDQQLRELGDIIAAERGRILELAAETSDTSD